MGKFCQFLTELSAHPPVFMFHDYSLNKYQWIFTKLGMCIYIVVLWFRILMGKFLSIFDRVTCHCIEPFIIPLPTSRYDFNNVKRDIKHKTSKNI